MLYGAIDIHKRTFHAAVLDVETGETSERRFGATRDELTDWAMPLKGRLAAVAIEATNGWRWVWRELSTLGFEVRLVDPAQAKALRGRVRRAKTDREGFQNVGSCCGAVVFVDQSAESVAALDLAGVLLLGGGSWFGRLQCESAVRALAVVVGGITA